MPLNFAAPLLLLPGLAALYLFWRIAPAKTLWRWALAIIAILLIARLGYQGHDKSLHICVIADRSLSIPADGITRQAELLEYITELPEIDRLSLVSFNSEAFLEGVSEKGLGMENFRIPSSPDGSDLAAAIELGLSLFQPGEDARILILGDGRFTGIDPRVWTSEAARKGVPLYYRDITAAGGIFNLSVGAMQGPEKPYTGEIFEAAFPVYASIAGTGRYRLLRNGTPFYANDDQGWTNWQFQRGINWVHFRDRAPRAGVIGYGIEVEGAQRFAETFTMDNQGTGYLRFTGRRPILLVNHSGQSDFATRAFTAAGIETHVAGISNFRLEGTDFTAYGAIVLNNIPLLDMEASQVTALRRYVEAEGGGLLVLGGKQSFASGGYYGSVLEDVLPVSLEDRQETRKLAAAFSFALDRSGSMAAPVGAGNLTKMDLANQAAVQSLELLTPIDSLSVIAVDSAAHVIWDQTQTIDFASTTEAILNINSMGGGIFVNTALMAAMDQLSKASQSNLHILLFADAADAEDDEDPGSWRIIIPEFVEAGGSISVVGLGSNTDADAQYLRDIADLGEGSVYFTHDPERLIEFFTADTLTYSRKRFIEEPVSATVGPGAYALAPEVPWEDFTAAGYNLLFQKDEAEVALFSSDEDRAPLLAFWPFGLGRCATLAFDVSGPFATLDQAALYLRSALFWTQGSDVRDDLIVSTEVEGPVARFTVDVSEEYRDETGMAQLRLFAPSGVDSTVPLQWEGALTLSATVHLDEPGVYLGAITMAGEDWRVPPVSRGGSAEFLFYRDAAYGREVLADLARATGGKRVQDMSALAEASEGSRNQWTSLALPLLLLAMLFFLLDAAEERFPLLSGIRRTVAPVVQKVTTRKTAKAYKSPKAPKTAQAPDTPEATEEPSAEKEESPTGDMDYLQESKKKASRKIRR